MCENNKATEGCPGFLQIPVPFSNSQPHTVPGPVCSHSLKSEVNTTIYLLRGSLETSSFFSSSLLYKWDNSRRLAALLLWLFAEIYLCLFWFQLISILKKATKIQGALMTLPSNLCGRAITCHSKLNFQKAEKSGFILFPLASVWASLAFVWQPPSFACCLISRWCHQPLYQKWDSIINVQQHDSSPVVTSDNRPGSAAVFLLLVISSRGATRGFSQPSATFVTK